MHSYGRGNRGLYAECLLSLEKQEQDLKWNVDEFFLGKKGTENLCPLLIGYPQNEVSQKFAKVEWNG